MFRFVCIDTTVASRKGRLGRNRKGFEFSVQRVYCKGKRLDSAVVYLALNEVFRALRCIYSRRQILNLYK